MEQKPIKLPLQQITTEDHVAKVMREKLGRILEKPEAGSRKPEVSSEGTLEEKIIAALRTIYDPEIPLNIYDLGLIYKIDISPANAVKIEMTLTAPGCPVAGDIVASVKNKIQSLPEVPMADIELVWEPPWTRERLSEAAKLELGLI